MAPAVKPGPLATSRPSLHPGPGASSLRVMNHHPHRHGWNRAAGDPRPGKLEPPQPPVAGRARGWNSTRGRGNAKGEDEAGGARRPKWCLQQPLSPDGQEAGMGTKQAPQAERPELRGCQRTGRETTIGPRLAGCRQAREAQEDLPPRDLPAQVPEGERGGTEAASPHGPCPSFDGRSAKPTWDRRDRHYNFRCSVPRLPSSAKVLEDPVVMTGASTKPDESDGPHTLRPSRVLTETRGRRRP